MYIMFIMKGLVDVLAEACEQLKWKTPTKIQKEALPVAFEGIFFVKNTTYLVKICLCPYYSNDLCPNKASTCFIFEVAVKFHRLLHYRHLPLILRLK